MKFFSILFALLALASCSKKEPSYDSGRIHEYTALFAAVKLPDTFLKDYDGTFDPADGYNFKTLESRYKLASHILANPDKFSLTTPTGNFLPIVKTGQETHIRLFLDPAREEKDFEFFGFKTTKFDAGIKVRETSSTGQITCSWNCSYMVHLKEPIGNSTDHGGDRPAGLVLREDQPDMTPLFQVNGVTLWVIVKLTKMPLRQ